MTASKQARTSSSPLWRGIGDRGKSSAPYRLLTSSCYESPLRFPPTQLQVWWGRSGWISSCISLSVGREGNRDLRPSSFQVKTDEDVVESATSVSSTMQTKNHQQVNEPNEENHKGLIFTLPGNPNRPRASLKTYLSKCPPDATSLYRHPRRSPQVEQRRTFGRLL